MRNACVHVDDDKRVYAAIETDGTVDLDEVGGVDARLEVEAVDVLCGDAHVGVRAHDLRDGNVRCARSCVQKLCRVVRLEPKVCPPRRRVFQKLSFCSPLLVCVCMHWKTQFS